MAERTMQADDIKREMAGSLREMILAKNSPGGFVESGRRFSDALKKFSNAYKGSLGVAGVSATWKDRAYHLCITLYDKFYGGIER